MSREYENIEVTSYEGDLAVGEEIAYRMRNAGYDVIISRGSTAKGIQKRVNIPVIDIGYSGYDFISALIMGKNLLQKPVVIISEKLKKRVEMIVKVLDLDFPIESVPLDTDKNNYTHPLRHIQETGQSVICYSNIIYQDALRMGIASILITSGEESVREAIDTAIQTSQIVRSERLRVSAYQKAMQLWTDTVFLLENVTNLCEQTAIDEVLRQLDAYNILDPLMHSDSVSITVQNEKFRLYRQVLDPDRDLVFYRLFKPAERFASGAISVYDTESQNLNVQCGFSVKKLLYYEKLGRRCYDNHYMLNLFGPAGSRKHVLAYYLFKQNSGTECVFFKVYCQTASAETFVVGIVYATVREKKGNIEIGTVDIKDE